MAWLSWQQAKRQESSLLSLDDFFTTPPVAAQMLTGGLTNRCWRVKDSLNQEYVWRPLSQMCQSFAISRNNEYQVLTALESTELAPKPIMLNEDGLLVEWINGTPLSDAELDTEEVIAIMASIHALSPDVYDLDRFSYVAKVKHYWHQLGGKYVGTEFELLYSKWCHEPLLFPVTEVLCHFDLGGYNLISHRSGIKVIDWEYAAVADPRIDLALSLPLTNTPFELGVRQYCRARQITDIKPWLEGVIAWYPRTMLMAMLWYLLAFRLWRSEQYFVSANELKQRLCLYGHCLDKS
ncbi:phosphotransferase [Vibrio sagamiensis]|uniref:Thiamine kinase n=1 Tax=Vibrio sagamiensis NBRC 104589 TaxID=1219064 RepID=A0A511QC43_9VIBR|nr:phosphotransferase [Vibrio sagamiensis]PNQ70257.1 thiamine kinase [Vibrio agarivorans]GEM74868.1 thiamine kinase [Vibrio sagamiensis NBRC 104589]